MCNYIIADNHRQASQMNIRLLWVSGFLSSQLSVICISMKRLDCFVLRSICFKNYDFSEQTDFSFKVPKDHFDGYILQCCNGLFQFIGI